jgi:hypothetical protein
MRAAGGRCGWRASVARAAVAALEVTADSWSLVTSPLARHEREHRLDGSFAAASGRSRGGDASAVVVCFAGPPSFACLDPPHLVERWFRGLHQNVCAVAPGE